MRAAGEGGAGATVLVSAPRGCAGLGSLLAELPLPAVLFFTFLVKLLQDDRKQGACRESAEGAERKLLLWSVLTELCCTGK